MKNLIIFKRHMLKKVLLILGVCGAGLMTTCAKYGTLVSTFFINLKGTVRSKENSQVISGIQVEVMSGNQSKGLTDANGAFSINSEIDDVGDNIVNLHISDIDGALNGSFLSKDTVITLTPNEKLAQLKENIDIKLVKNE